MAEISDILKELEYVDTIDHTIDEIGLTVTVAEASAVRNRPFARRLTEVMAREDIDDPSKMSKEGHIEIICETLLRGWDAQRDGKPVPVEEAREILTANIEQGHQISVHIELAASASARFRKSGTKKKQSSGSTPNTSRSAKRRSPSKARPKAAASRSPRKSKDT